MCYCIALSQIKLLSRGFASNFLKLNQNGDVDFIQHGFFVPRRKLWGWLNSVFNQVDESRITEVGPDRACAEWLLRCGAHVKWKKADSWIRDYNSLPVSGGRLLKIEEVDATDSAVMSEGFSYFKGCQEIRKIIFHRSSYLDNEALKLLVCMKNSLQNLQVSSCGDISIEGIHHLKRLHNLQHLLLYDLPLITDKEAVIKELQIAIPNCKVVFPYSQAKDEPSDATTEKGSTKPI